MLDFQISQPPQALEGVRPPRLFVHRQITQVAAMSFRGPFTTIQVVLKAYALRSLFGVDASTLTKTSTALSQLCPGVGSAADLEKTLVSTENNFERLTLLTRLIQSLKASETNRDEVVEESIALISRDIATISVRLLRKHLGISERQFEKRFTKAVGIAPKLSIRISRTNDVVASSYLSRQKHLRSQSRFFTIISMTGLSTLSTELEESQTRRAPIGHSYCHQQRDARRGDASAGTAG